MSSSNPDSDFQGPELPLFFPFVCGMSKWHQPPPKDLGAESWQSHQATRQRRGRHTAETRAPPGRGPPCSVPRTRPARFLWASLPALRKTTPPFTEGETEGLEGRDLARPGRWAEGPRRLVLSLGPVGLRADALLSAFLVLESSCWGSDRMAPSAAPPSAAYAQESRPPDLGPHCFFLFSDKP